MEACKPDIYKASRHTLWRGIPLQITTMFNLSDTAEKIVTSELIEKGFFLYFPRVFADLLSSEERRIPIGQVGKTRKMPWGVPFLSQDFVDAANMTERIFDDPGCHYIKLWSENQDLRFIPRIDSSHECVTLLAYNARQNKGSLPRPAAIVCPGGAYAGVAFLHEGMDTAIELEKNGYAVFVLYYRTAPNRYPKPQTDLAIAVKYVRAHAGEYGIDPDNLLVTGYSAGGHLVASESLYAEEIEAELMKELKNQYPGLYKMYDGISVKADKISLNYPVISMKQDTHAESVKNLTNNEEGLCDKLSIELHAGPDFPKTFVWANDDDADVDPKNAGRLAERLQSQNVPVMYRTFPSGGHGCAVGYGTSCYGWMDLMMRWLK